MPNLQGLGNNIQHWYGNGDAWQDFKCKGRQDSSLEEMPVFFQQVVAFAKKYKISLDKPLKDLPASQLNLLLYGDKEINPALEMDMSDETIPYNRFYTNGYEGIIPMLKRWFSSSAKYRCAERMGWKIYAACQMQYLQWDKIEKESLWF